MLALEDLKNLLPNPVLEHVDRLLLCLASCEHKSSSVAEIRSVGERAGLRGVKTINISRDLARASDHAIRTIDGWELTDKGLRHIDDLLGRTDRVSLSTVTVRALRQHVALITNAETRAFLEEAVECIGSRLYRAAVVLSWVGAISKLYEYVVLHHLVEFNAEAQRRDSRRKLIKTGDDMGKIGEYDFLQIIETLSIIGKNVKAELEDCLRLRNGCGHSNSLKLGEAVVAAHVEILVLNVFKKF